MIDGAKGREKTETGLSAGGKAKGIECHVRKRGLFLELCENVSFWCSTLFQSGFERIYIRGKQLSPLALFGHLNLSTLKL